MTFGILGIIATAIATIVALYDGSGTEKSEDTFYFGLSKIKIWLLFCAVTVALVSGYNTWLDEVDKNEAVKRSKELSIKLDQANAELSCTKSQVIDSKEIVIKLQSELKIERRRANLIALITRKNADNINPKDQNNIKTGEDGRITLIRIRDSIRESDSSKSVTKEEFNFIKNELIELGDAEHLTTLIIQGGAIGDLSGLGNFVNLEYLDLQKLKNIEDEDLINLNGLKKLEFLNLDETKVTGPGLKHLQGCASLKKIILGHLDGFQIETAIKYIGQIPSIEDLNFYGTPFQVSATGNELEPLTTLKKLMNITSGGPPGEVANLSSTKYDELKKVMEKRKTDKEQ